MATVYTLTTTHADGTGEIIHAADINANASAINEMSARRYMMWPRHLSQQRYSVRDIVGGAVAAAAVAANQIYANWIPIPEPNVTYDRIDIEVGTAGAAGKIARLMVFDDDGTGGRPGTLLLNAGTVLVDATGQRSIASLTFVPPSGGVWGSFVSDGTPSVYGVDIPDNTPLGYDSGGVGIVGWSYALGSTTAPSPFSATAAIDTGRAFFVSLRRS